MSEKPMNFSQYHPYNCDDCDDYGKGLCRLCMETDLDAAHKIIRACSGMTLPDVLARLRCPMGPEQIAEQIKQKVCSLPHHRRVSRQKHKNGEIVSEHEILDAVLIGDVLNILSDLTAASKEG